MLDLEFLKVERFTPVSLYVSWKFTDTLEDLSNYRLSLYRSQAPSNRIEDYDVVFNNFAMSVSSYSDDYVNGLDHGTRQWYYLLKLTNIETSEEEVLPKTHPAYINDSRLDRKWLYIYNQKKLALERKSGRNFYLLKKRTWGERCEVSWDPILFTRNNNVCDTCNCWGTGWREGYFKPLVILGQLNPTPSIKQIAFFGEFYPSDSILTMLADPPLESGDVIIDPLTDKRYSVQRKRGIELMGRPIEQQAQVSLIHISDGIYKYNAVDNL